MLQHLVDRLNSRNIILASGSPRRKELIHSLDLRFDVVLSRFDEKTLDKKTFASPALFVQACAVHKALEVSQRLMSQYAAGLRGAPDLVIGSDTIVCIDNMILEKPVDENDAFRMLSTLSGRHHLVYTGVALILPRAVDKQGVTPVIQEFSICTEVTFSKLSDEAIWAYIATKDPLDKAGSYG